MKKTKYKLDVVGRILLFLFAAAVMTILLLLLTALGKQGYQDLYLADTKEHQNGWVYEARMPDGSVDTITPEYIDEYYTGIPQGEYNALKQSRVMTEEMNGPILSFGANHKVEVFLDGELLYSDISGEERDEHGYLVIHQEQAEVQEDYYRDINVSLPYDYMGKTLHIISYYPKDDTYRYLINVNMTGLNELYTPVIMESYRETLVYFLFLLLLLVSILIMLVSLWNRRNDWKPVPFVVMYLWMFLCYIYKSSFGYYSGFSEYINSNKVLSWLIFHENLSSCMIFLVYAIFLFVLLFLERKKNNFQLPFPLLLLYMFGSVSLTLYVNSTELEGGSWGLVKTIWINRQDPHFIQMFFSIIVTVLLDMVILVFLSGEVISLVHVYREKTALFERSRFALENYELITQLSEDSRKRNHEVRHQIQTMYEMIEEGQSEKAREYALSILEGIDKREIRTYSDNIVVNATLAAALGTAIRDGIRVEYHVNIPKELSMEDVDLNILLSNMVENAVEACSRMEDTGKAYIDITISKHNKFLFIECINSVDMKESKPKYHEWVTTKKNVREHGYGIPLMEQIADKYAGIIQIERREGEFVVRTNLCLPE